MRKTIQKAIMSAAAFLLASLVVLAQGSQTVRLEASAADVAAQGGGHLYYYLDPVKAGKGWLDKYYLEPIPSEELLLNSALEQQTGWK